MNFFIVRRGIDNALAKRLLLRLQSFLVDLPLEYPFFFKWLEKVFDELQTTNRRIIVLCYEMDVLDIKGVAILKSTEKERKICTLRVLKPYQKRGIGTMLLRKSQELLADERPLITVSGIHLKEFSRFLRKNGFILKDKVKSLYRKGCYEYFFNVPYEHKTVLLSVKPEYASAISMGMKKVEFRKKIFVDTVEEVFVYSSLPQKKIIGNFSVHHIEKGTPSEIWKKYSNAGCISKDKYDAYYQGCTTAYGIEIYAFINYESPLDPYEYDSSFRPPQSYCYVDNVEFLNWLSKNGRQKL